MQGLGISRSAEAQTTTTRQARVIIYSAFQQQQKNALHYTTDEADKAEKHVEWVQCAHAPLCLAQTHTHTHTPLDPGHTGAGASATRTTQIPPCLLFPVPSPLPLPLKVPLPLPPSLVHRAHVCRGCGVTCARHAPSAGQDC